MIVLNLIQLIVNVKCRHRDAEIYVGFIINSHKSNAILGLHTCIKLNLIKKYVITMIDKNKCISCNHEVFEGMANLQKNGSKKVVPVKC